MMKFAVATLAVLALASSSVAYKVPSTGSGALAKELQDFVDVLPLDQMTSIVMRYVSEDQEVQKVLTYLQTAEFRNLVSAIEGMHEVITLMDYVQHAGVDVYHIVNVVNQYLHIPKLTPPAVYLMRATHGIRGMLDEIEAMLPKQKLQALYKTKMQNSRVFADFVARMQGPEAQTIANNICKNSNFNSLVNRAQQAQIDVNAAMELLERFLGIKVPCHV